MKNLVEIDVNENEKTVTLPKLLNEFSDIGNKYHWSILFLWATGDLGSNKNMGDLVSEIDDSESGLILSWNNLNEIATKFYQTIEILLVASTDSNAIKKYEFDNDELCSHYPIVIGLFDGGFWTVWAKDSNLIKHLKNKFENTTYVELSNLVGFIS